MNKQHICNKTLYIAIISILLFVTACSSSSDTPPSLGPSQTSGVLPLPSAAVNPGDVFDTPTLHFQVNNLWRSAENTDVQMHLLGFYCVPYSDLVTFFFHGFDNLPSQNLLLAEEKATYDPDEIQAMDRYFEEVRHHIGSLQLWSPPNPPATLRWLPGGSQCGSIVQITNKRTSGLEISAFGFHLTATPTPNTNVYDLVDPCLPHKPCYGAIGGSVSCLYTAKLSLEVGISASFENPVQAEGACPTTLVVPPFGSEELVITIQDAAHASMTYQGEPYLVVLSPSGKKETILFSGLRSTLYLTNTDDFPCYGLQENIFRLQPKVDGLCQ